MKKIAGLNVLLALSVCACAPRGYMYDTGSFVPRPRDSCARPELERTLIGSLNQKIGRPDGPPAAVVAIGGLASPGAIVENPMGSITCRGIMRLADGQTDSGVVSAFDGSGRAVFDGSNLNVTWRSDAVVARLVASAQKPVAEPPQSPLPEPVPIEDKAVLFEDSKSFREFTDKLARLVQSNDFSCDSVSAARPMLTSRGYVLTCNRFAYTYNIQDRGGHWTVSVQ